MTVYSNILPIKKKEKMEKDKLSSTSEHQCLYKSSEEKETHQEKVLYLKFIKRLLKS